MERNNFNFWCPIEISKAKDKDGEEVMLLGGIASTADEDSDGEFLDPKGFDIKPLLESGMVNWHHQAKTCPATIVGEPTKAEITKKGLYIETLLYPSSSVARDIWELAKTLDKDSNTRRLGYSIEGRVLERESDDKNSAGYKKITKAVITGVAITHQPKNPKTFANIIKGEIDDDLEDDEENTENEVEKEKNEKKKEKSLDTDSGRPLIKEDLDRKLKITTFGKSMVMDKIFQDIPGISIEKAKKVYTLIKNISNMARKKFITEEDIRKAYDALGLDSTDIVKADNDSEEEEIEEEDVDIKKTKSKKTAAEENFEEEEIEEEDELDDEENEDEEVEDDYEEDEEAEEETKTVKKGGVFDRLNRIEKAIAKSYYHNTSYIKALGVMIKAGNNELQKARKVIQLSDAKINELQEINKAQSDTIESLSEQLAAYGSQTPAPKSIRHSAPIERTFGKAQEDELKKAYDANSVSIADKSAVAEILDQATFSKGYDQEFSKACLEFEATGNISTNIISRIKNEFGISITK